MFEGGISFNSNSDKAVRYIALLGTPIFVGYNFLIFFGIAHSSNYAGNFACLLISALWLVVGAYHFFAPIRSQFDMLGRLVLYHALALATIVFITGFLEPFASSITLLFLASNVYFGRKALAISVGSVLLAAIIDSIVRYPSDHMIIINNALGTGAILVLGLAMVGIIIAQETRRQALVQSQAGERLQYDRILTIINNLSDATFSTDDKGNILMYNAACLNLLDTNEDLKGVNIDGLFNLTNADKSTVKLFDILSKASKTVRRDDIRHTYSDGEEIRLEMTYAPIKSTYSRRKKGQIQAGFILIVRDVTKQKSLEEERDEFISVVSHELRTPITIVEGTLSNLQVMVNMPKKLEETVLKGSLSTAHDQVLYLAKMVNDLSTLSRAERGVADAGEDINVEELMHKLHKEYEKNASARKLHLNLDLGTKLGTIHVSRLYVEELLQNFITNAIKYTNEGSITVSAKAKSGKVHFAVKDSGVGISRGDQQKIFAKFYRSEDYRVRETNGTGLGLYVSAKLAHKIGTQINVTSRLNHGSTFSFNLPQNDK
ncbi:MAG: putative Multi-sensor signal transduction histidine kinase [Candidatus Saccharibacteria bacterium]|nr:putative Multi-sensor signal transduction histidine kinase [Candidatus Saccharibacteria bacterium]